MSVFMQTSPAQNSKLIRRRFADPPAAFGPVPFWWWAGEPVRQDRLRWQLDQLAAQGIAGVCISCPHQPNDAGTILQSDPRLWSKSWWELLRWVLAECRRRGLRVWFSGYIIENQTLGEIAARQPALRGWSLACRLIRCRTGRPVALRLPDNAALIGATACRFDGKILIPGTAVDLASRIRSGRCRWTAPDESWRVAVISAQRQFIGPLEPGSGRALVRAFYQRFAEHIPDELGKTFAGFFTDELWAGAGHLQWSADFQQEFICRKGYDLRPFLSALWQDIGPRTAKVRLDYYDVCVALAERHFYRPVFDFMDRHGLLHGHDQMGRGSILAQTSRYLDYFRTQRWYSAPGYEVSGRYLSLGRQSFFSAKTASSIAHLYRRPRVWLEAFHSTGWGATLASMVQWINENYAYGATLFDKHGLYYSTCGGWWEWAPPDGHFRQPYWRHYRALSDYVTRLSYLLSQGAHVCDVGMLYPAVAVQSGWQGQGGSSEAFSVEAQAAHETLLVLSRDLLDRGIDHDYIDDDSLAGAVIRDRALHVAGHDFRVLLLPAVSTIRAATLAKIRDFHQAGGVVIACGCLPSAGDRQGGDDPDLNALVKDIFGLTAADAVRCRSLACRRQPAGGVAWFVPAGFAYANIVLPRGYGQVPRLIAEAIPRDCIPSLDHVLVLHRKMKAQDIYFIVNARGQTATFEVFFRAAGTPQFWDAWTGAVRPATRFRRQGAGACVTLTLGSGAAELVVFSRGADRPGVAEDNLDVITAVSAAAKKLVIRGWAQTGGEKTAVVRSGESAWLLKRRVSAPPPPMALGGWWDIELEPTLDNRWGDFRLPAEPRLIGPEVCRFRYAEETHFNRRWALPEWDDSRWPEVTCSFGPYFWALGPIPPGINTDDLEKRLAGLQKIDPDRPVQAGPIRLRWQRVSFSKRWGIEKDPVLMDPGTGPHGLKIRVPDEFIDLGSHPAGTRFYLWTTARVDQAIQTFLNLGSNGQCQAWLNGRVVLAGKGSRRVVLCAGTNPLLIQFQQTDNPLRLGYSNHPVGLRAYAALGPKGTGVNTVALTGRPPVMSGVMQGPLALRWFRNLNVPVFDIFPPAHRRIGWYRFRAPPGLRALDLVAPGRLQSWVNGRSCPVEPGERMPDGTTHYVITVPGICPRCAAVALRLELAPGCYAGAAIPEPVRLACGPGRVRLGPWADNGLSAYSGAARYRRSFQLSRRHLGQAAILDLGALNGTAEVKVNGRNAGVRVAAPWQFELTPHVRSGRNELEIVITNTLVPYWHARTPSPYNYPLASAGLVGPVTIRFLAPVTLAGRQ